jgi:hypothetical protein
MTSREKYAADREELLARREMLQANVDALIGKVEEE